MADVLTDSDVTLLDRLVEEGHWEQTTSAIEAIRVAQLQAAAGAEFVVMGVQDADGFYMLAWEVVRSPSGVLFQGADVQQPTVNDISEYDTAPFRRIVTN